MPFEASFLFIQLNVSNHNKCTFKISLLHFRPESISSLPLDLSDLTIFRWTIVYTKTLKCHFTTSEQHVKITNENQASGCSYPKCPYMNFSYCTRSSLHDWISVILRHLVNSVNNNILTLNDFLLSSTSLNIFESMHSFNCSSTSIYTIITPIQ